MFFPRYLKKKKWWLKTHRRIGISGTVFGVVGIAVAVYMITQTTGIHLRVPHTWIGLVTFILMIIMPLLGYFMLKIRKNPYRAKRTRAVHRWIGRITLLFMAATIVLGLFQAGIL
jgi:putative copper export protein